MSQVTRALSSRGEPVLWYDVAEHAVRGPDGAWTGEWLPLPDDPRAVDAPDAAALSFAQSLGEHWVGELARRPDDSVSPAWGLWHGGPILLLAVARVLGAGIRASGLRAAIGGSFAVYVQRPFRISADLDLAMPARLDTAEQATLARCLEAHGVTVTESKGSYTGGFVDVVGTRVSIDIECGYAYGTPLSDDAWSRRRDLLGLECLDHVDLLELKRRADRPKDRSDLEFVRRAPLPNGSLTTEAPSEGR